jgi:hypothetical protein
MFLIRQSKLAIFVPKEKGATMIFPRAPPIAISFPSSCLETGLGAKLQLRLIMVILVPEKKQELFLPMGFPSRSLGTRKEAENGGTGFSPVPAQAKACGYQTDP